MPLDAKKLRKKEWRVKYLRVRPLIDPTFLQLKEQKLVKWLFYGDATMLYLLFWKVLTSEDKIDLLCWPLNLPTEGTSFERNILNERTNFVPWYPEIRWLLTFYRNFPPKETPFKIFLMGQVPSLFCHPVNYLTFPCGSSWCNKLLLQWPQGKNINLSLGWLTLSKRGWI